MMRRPALLLICIGLALLPWAGRVDAHKFHASLTQIDHNAETGTAEASVRLFTDDLEAALGRRLGERVRLDSSPRFDDEILAYLDETLLLTPAGTTDSVRWEWVGKELQTDVIWIYLQCKLSDGFDGATALNTVFFELFDDQVNLVNFRGGERRASLAFKPGDRAVPVSFDGAAR